jgi:abequosyltransferase
MGIKLSICIPTYNFADFIGATLESVIPEATSEVEIVVVDGASKDNTREIVQDYQKKFPRLHLFSRDKNVGVDRDLAKSVELAQGEYCWFLSSDDTLKKGAIKRILAEIENDCDIYLCNRVECDFNLKPLKDRLWLSRDVGDKVFNIADKTELMKYLDKACSIGALFSYCSSIIFKRQRWNSVSYDEKFIGTGYAHVNILFSFNNTLSKLKYIKEPLVFCRGDNDSFLKQGTVKRFLIDIEGYNLLASHLFGDSNIRDAFLKVVRREIKLNYLLKIRSLTKDITLWDDIEKKLTTCGYSMVRLRFIRIFGSLKWIVLFLDYIKKRMKRYTPILYSFNKLHIN